MIKEERKAERQKKTRFKVILLTILSLILVIAASALIVVKVFVVKNVKVEGNVLYDEALIKSTVLNDEYSWNSLYVLLKYTFTDTEQLPFIDTMEIQMEDPETLKIKVYEKGMMGYLYIPAIGENAYFDKDGIVVETSTRIIENVPRIEGLQCSEVVLYEKLPVDDKLLKQLLTLTQTLKRDGLEPDAIRYGTEHEPVLIYDSVSVNLGSMELLTQKVERMKKILPELEGMAGTLHLENWTEESTNIVFKRAE
ncbi:MAG: cell division protein FtsQ [Agathobacter sp.]|nr:cell division protein FtsQ [Agathobacter sp.]